MEERTERPMRETIRVEGGQLVDRLKELVHEGNVRKISIKQDDRVIVEFPVTLGVIGAALAPWLAAAGAIAALVTHCSIEVERAEPRPTEEAPAIADETAAPSSPTIEDSTSA